MRAISAPLSQRTTEDLHGKLTFCSLSLFCFASCSLILVFSLWARYRAVRRKSPHTQVHTDISTLEPPKSGGHCSDMLHTCTKVPICNVKPLRSKCHIYFCVFAMLHRNTLRHFDLSNFHQSQNGFVTD